MSDELSRYSRQVLFKPIGQEGQRRLLEARVVLIGCGALGSSLANLMVRAGVGFLRIVDRDYLELSNLQRQVLFDEDDLAADLPKAEAAARKLRRINSQVRIEPVVVDANYRNIEALAEAADLLLDGTDNFETRYLVNDLAVKTHRPWVYGACAGAVGLAMPILPHDTPCLRCLFEQAPPPEFNPTCETVGILGPVVQMVAGHQAVEAIKILTGNLAALDRRLLSFDAWTARSTSINVQRAYAEGDCPCCQRGRFDYLDGRLAGEVTTLCGRDAIQVTPACASRVDFAALADKLAAVPGARPRFNPFLLRARLDGCELTVFADGRAIVKGTTRTDQARTICARYLGT